MNRGGIVTAALVVVLVVVGAASMWSIVHVGQRDVCASASPEMPCGWGR